MTESRSAIRQPILVVEDDDDIREFVAAVLEHVGYSVTVAPNGAVALEIVDREPPRVILLDMKMPIMDGWEFARQYQEHHPDPAPLIIMTAAHDTTVRGSQVGAVGVLNKPFDLENLLSVVASVLPTDARLSSSLGVKPNERPPFTPVRPAAGAR